MSFLYLLLPDELLPILIVIVALGLIIGIVRPRTVKSIIGTVILCLLIGPFIEAIIASLPAMFALMIIVAFGFFLMSKMIRATLGDHVSGHVLGVFVVFLVRGLFRLIFLPMRLLFGVIGFGMRRVVGL